MRGWFYRACFTTWTSLPKFLRYHLWSTMARIGRRYWRDPGAQRIPFGMFLKRGHKCRLQEGFATQFVGMMTDIPVPTVIDILDYRGEVFLILSALPGESLSGSFRDLSDDERLHFEDQLRVHLTKLRSIPPPASTVCGFMGTPLHDDRISMALKPFGPFPSVADFHRFLIERSALDIPPEVEDDVLDRIKLSHARQHRICLTHGDLHPQNILIDDKKNITGILDWECAAWLPEYWEYTRAQYLPWFRRGPWHNIMTSVLPGYETEYEAEKYIWKYRRIYA